MCLVSSDDSEGLESTKDPLEEMNAGLLDSSGQKLPLQAVNVRCKLMDLLCQVWTASVWEKSCQSLIFSLTC